jgi:hypothetical protein
VNPKKPSERHENEQTAATVLRATERPTHIHADADAAWTAWSKQLHRVDPRALTLLREALDAGQAAHFLSPAAELGRLGASRGGAARAASLTKSRRAEIAKKAAWARWRHQREVSAAGTRSSLQQGA